MRWLQAGSQRSSKSSSINPNNPHVWNDGGDFSRLREQRPGNEGRTGPEESTRAGSGPSWHRPNTIVIVGRMKFWPSGFIAPLQAQILWTAARWQPSLQHLQSTNESIPAGVSDLERKQTLLINVWMHHPTQLALENTLRSFVWLWNPLCFITCVLCWLICEPSGNRSGSLCPRRQSQFLWNSISHHNKVVVQHKQRPRGDSQTGSRALWHRGTWRHHVSNRC